MPGRTFTALAQTAPGVTGVGGGGVNAGGQLNRNNSYRIDGVSNDNNVLASPRGGLSMEAVREYIVIANQFAAEHGDASGAIVSVVTRSGTNNLQGRGFLFHRDESLDAQDPFSKAQGSGQAPFSQQRGGGFLGGPIKTRPDALLRHLRGRARSIRRRSSRRRSCPPIEREVPNPSKGDQFFVRTDNRLTSNHTMFVRYRIDKQLEENSGVGGLNTFERGVDSINRNQDVRRAAIPACCRTARSTSCASSSAATSPTTSCARRSTQPTINRPSGQLRQAEQPAAGPHRGPSGRS